jgi:hypothetical protein
MTLCKITVAVYISQVAFARIATYCFWFQSLQWVVSAVLSDEGGFVSSLIKYRHFENVRQTTVGSNTGRKKIVLSPTSKGEPAENLYSK